MTPTPVTIEGETGLRIIERNVINRYDNTEMNDEQARSWALACVVSMRPFQILRGEEAESSDVIGEHLAAADRLVAWVRGEER